MDDICGICNQEKQADHICIIPVVLSQEVNEEPEKNYHEIDDTVHAYQCQQCEKIYPKLEELEHHWASELSECSVCGSTFCSLEAMNEHLAQHTSATKEKIPKEQPSTKRPYCLLCKEVFLNEEDLQIHMEITKINCHICGLICCSTSAINTHLATKHTNKQSREISFTGPKCKQCKEVFLNDDDLKKHTDITKVGCHICNMKCCSLGIMLRHLARHTAIARDRNINQPQDNSNAEPQCTLCKGIFPSSEDLKQHMKLMKVRCQICKLICCSLSAMKKHLTVHTGSSTKKNTKQSVRKTKTREKSDHSWDLKERIEFYSRRARRPVLPKHTANCLEKEPIVKQPQKPSSVTNKVKCDDQCGEFFRDEKELDKHKGGVRLNCRMCGLKCCSLRSLTKHVAVHKKTDKRAEKSVTVFKCNGQCGDTFRDKYRLKIHQEYVKIACNVCGLKCCTTYSLKKHLETHQSAS